MNTKNPEPFTTESQRTTEFTKKELRLKRFISFISLCVSVPLWYMVLCGFVAFSLTGCDKIKGLVKTKPVPNKQTEALTQPFIDESKVLAKVNSRTITIDEFKKNFENLPGGYDSVKIQDRRRILDDTIRIELLYQDAARRGLERDDDVKRLIDEAKRQILAAQLIKLEFDNVRVEPKEIEDFYNTYKNEFAEPEQITLRQIVVDTEEEAKQILVELLQGNAADFAQVAKARSKAPNAKDGGLVESVKKGELFSQLDNAAFSLEIGAISGVVKGPDGYYIVRLESKIPQKQKTLSQAWDEIKDGLLILKRNKALEDKISQLKSQADKLEIYEERL